MGLFVIFIFIICIIIAALFIDTAIVIIINIPFLVLPFASSPLPQDLADHGKLGKPYRIVTDEDVGRHMVAVRDIKAGQVP